MTGAVGVIGAVLIFGHAFKPLLLRKHVVILPPLATGVTTCFAAAQCIRRRARGEWQYLLNQSILGSKLKAYKGIMSVLLGLILF